MKTFAAIYKKSDDGKYLKLDNVALIDYFDLDEIFIVETGKYRHTTSSAYNILTVEKDSILECPQEVFISEDNNEDKYMYIFSEDFYNEKMKEDGFFSNIIKRLAEELAPISLVINKDGSIFTKRTNNKSFDYDGLDTSMNDDKDDDGLPDKIPSELANKLLIASVLGTINDMLNKSREDQEENEEEEETIQFIPVDISFPAELNSQGLPNVLRKKLEESKKIAQEQKEKEKIDPSKINKMIDEISNKIVGQRKTIETLVSNIYYNQVLIDNLTKDGEYDPSRLDSSKVAILLDGETGTGKTAIEKEIAKMLGLPIVITNANSFSETGYVGPTITDILNKLLEQANGDLEKAERGIIVLDEIDKVASKDYVYGKDMDKGVQEELLSFIGGGKYDIREGGLFSKSTTFDTSKITFILSGAFTDLREEKIKEEKKKSNPMGFNSNGEERNSYEVTPEDYIKYGLMREFFGRIKVLTSTKSYKLEDLKTILLTSVISPLRNFENAVQMFGYSGISYDDSFVTEVAEEALKMGTGARSLQTIMSGIQSNMLMGLINQEYDKDKPIKLEKKLILDYKNNNIREF